MDLAPGSSLSLLYRDLAVAMTQDELCDGVQQVADEAMSTLLTLV